MIPYKGSLLFSFEYMHPFEPSIAGVIAINDHGTVVSVLGVYVTVYSTTNIDGDMFVLGNNGLWELVESTLVMAE